MLALQMCRVTANHLKDKATKAMVADHRYLPSAMHLPRVILLPASTKHHQAGWCTHKAMAQCPTMLHTQTHRTGTRNKGSLSTRIVRSLYIPYSRSKS